MGIGVNVLQKIIGFFSDYVSVPYNPSGQNSLMAYLRTGYYHVHGRPFVYPNHADNILLTAGAGAWNLDGDIIEVVPATTLTVSSFDIHWINIENVSENATIQVDVFSGAEGEEVLISSARATRSTVTSPGDPHRLQIPQQESGARISCRLSSSVAGATTCTVSFEGHYYAQ